MIDTDVVRILHGEHPAQVEIELVEDVGCLVAALRDVHVQTIIVRLVLFVGAEHDTYGESGVDDVLVEVTGIVPAVR